MVKKIDPGKQVQQYKILALLNQGGFALAYAAQDSSGQKVFLKQYKSPSVTVGWYKNYVNYQQELKRRIADSNARQFSYKLLDSFEAVYAHPCFFQVFEFVEEGHDLEKQLGEIRAADPAASWLQCVIFAKAIMASVNAFHLAGIVHADLKPPNILLFKDDTITSGYVVKLIDLDNSVLTDRLPPWHGIENYVGTPGYFSPEHSQMGVAPTLGSDVFTCGLILYEVLAQGHPYQFDTPEEYHQAVLGHKAPRPKLRGTMPAPANNTDVEEVLYRCLSPALHERPTARDVLAVLNGRAKPPAIDHSALPEGVAPPIPATFGLPPLPMPAAPAGTDPMATLRPAVIGSPMPGEAVAPVLRLVGETGVEIQMRVSTQVGRYLLRPLGPDHVYFDNHQFTMDRADDGQWFVSHQAAAKHQTLLNGVQVRERVPVVHGDVLAVGSQERKIQKLMLTVQIT